MKLPQQYTSRAAVGAGSAAAQQDVQLALQTGRSKLQQGQQIQKFGQQVTKMGMAKEYNEGKMQMDIASANAQAEIKNNPVLPMDQVSAAGVDTNSIPKSARFTKGEGADAREYVRTWAVADQYYAAVTGAAKSAALEGASVPAVSRQLGYHAETQLETKGRLAVEAMSLGQYRADASASLNADITAYDEIGDYEGMRDTIDVALAGGVITSDEARKLDDESYLLGEIRDNNLLIIEARKGGEGVKAIQKQIDSYAKQLGGKITTSNFESGPLYVERERLLSALDEATRAAKTSASISLVDEKRALKNVGIQADKGDDNNAAAVVKQSRELIAYIEKHGLASQTKIDTFKQDIEAATFRAAHTRDFADIYSSGEGSALAAKSAVERIRRADRDNIYGDPTNSKLLLAEAEKAYAKRQSMIAQNPAAWADQHNEPVQQANLAAAEASANMAGRPTPEDVAIYTAALHDVITAQTVAQTADGVPAHKVQVFDTDNVALKTMAGIFDEGKWSRVEPLLGMLSAEYSPEDYRLLAQSVKALATPESNLMQSAMLAYRGNPEIARQIMSGANLEPRYSRADMDATLYTTIGNTISPAKRDELMPVFASMYRSLQDSGKMTGDPLVDADKITTMVDNMLGEVVDVGAVAGVSAPVRSYRRDGAWVSRADLKRQFYASARDPSIALTFAGSGETYSLRDVMEVATPISVGNGRYRFYVNRLAGGLGVIENLKGEAYELDLNTRPLEVRAPYDPNTSLLSPGL